MAKKAAPDPTLASNRKAFHDYNVIEKFEAGIQLTGTEVKSCRARAIQLNEGFAKIEKGQLLLHNVHIAAYDFGNRFNHKATQTRELLMHRKEILKLSQTLKTKGGTIIPLKFYLKGGLVKVEIAYCQGKTHADKRETLKKRESDREISRAIKK